VVVVAQVDSPLSYGFYVKAGTVADLMRSTTAYVILAHQTPEFSSRVMQLWSKNNHARPPRDLGARLTRIKRQGFEEQESHEVEGVINISFPILDDRGCAMAALSVPFVQRIGDQTTPVVVRRILKGASSLLTEAIGGTATQQRPEVKQSK
jgi:DNA-binding IclR family transcriptional regulator